MQKYRLVLTFSEPLLGSQPQREVATEFLRKKALDAGATEGEVDETIDSIPEAIEKGTTGFHRDAAGDPALWNYQVKGFLKEAGLVFNGAGNSGGVKNLRSKVAATVFVGPRLIPLRVPDGGGVTINERPLRAMTQQGPRVGLARSEELPAGTSISAELSVLKPEITEGLLRELLDYGQFIGLGQWRSGSWGTFTYELTRE
jgi:hypothetical protein